MKDALFPPLTPSYTSWAGRCFERKRRVREESEEGAD